MNLYIYNLVLFKNTLIELEKRKVPIGNCFLLNIRDVNEIK